MPDETSPEGEPTRESPKSTEQELTEDRYYQAVAEGLAEIVKSAQKGIAEPQLRDDFSKLLSGLNWAIGVNEDPSLYRPGVQAVIGYLGKELFSDDPSAFIDNPKHPSKRGSRDLPLKPRAFGLTAYDFDRFKSNRI